MTSIAANDLIQGLNQVVRAAANDDARPLLTGVLFTTDNGILRMIATDSYRLAVRDVPEVEGIGGAHDLLVPARALQELQRAAASLPDDGQIGVTLTDAEICFVVGGTSIASRLIDGNYPVRAAVDSRELPEPITSSQGHVAHFIEAGQVARQGFDLLGSTDDEGSFR